MNGLIFAILAAILFGVSPLFMKSGVKKTPSYLGAAVWTTVMLIFAIVQVGRTGTVTKLSSLGNIRLLLLVLSGIALGGAIIFLFHDPIQNTHYTSSSCLLKFLLAVTVSDSFCFW